MIKITTESCSSCVLCTKVDYDDYCNFLKRNVYDTHLKIPKDCPLLKDSIEIKLQAKYDRSRTDR